MPGPVLEWLFVCGCDRFGCVCVSSNDASILPSGVKGDVLCHRVLYSVKAVSTVSCIRS